ncbi:MAG: hypothetical protein II836_03015 [Clostridia bacterium]|nr:hypothetical protein [Clostridia bacterium]MBQ3815004.1 hypothetical protein [Clostridia bacterium]
MKELYRVEGVVNRGFVGQITYTVCLEETLEKLDIHFSFDADKRTFRPEDVTDELIRDTIETCRRNYDLAIGEERARQIVLGDMKTEIHTLATINDEFLGCIHKQLTDRHMRYDGGTASEGCIPRESFDGVLKVTVLVFNVIKDGTHYCLTVSGE